MKHYIQSIIFAVGAALISTACSMEPIRDDAPAETATVSPTGKIAPTTPKTADASSPDKSISADSMGIDRNGIRQVFLNHQKSLSKCYDDRLTKNPKIGDGKIKFDFDVNKDGAVTRADVMENQTGDKELGTCITDQIKSWSFPPPKLKADDPKLRVIYPMSFAKTQKGAHLNSQADKNAAPAPNPNSPRQNKAEQLKDKIESIRKKH